MKILPIITLFLLLLSAAYAYDLSSIEETFVKEGVITADVVVGDAGTSSDVLAQLQIITYLGTYSDMPPSGGKLASEINDIYAKDLILIGNPCVNKITKEIMDYDGDCSFSEGLMKFYNKNNKNQLVIYTLSEKTIRDAATSITRGEVSGEEKTIPPTAEEKKDAAAEELLERIQEQEPEEEPEPEIDLDEQAQAVVDEAQKKSWWRRFLDWLKRIFFRN